MIAQLREADRDRLGRCLALAEAGSNSHLGERIAALLAAERLLARHGLRLRDLAASQSGQRARVVPNDWRSICRLCRDHPATLTAWERDFLDELLKFLKISDKQQHCLESIARRLGVLEDAAA